MATRTLIGIDIGTTAVKAVLLDLGGTRLAEYVRPYAISRPAPGAAEQDPADWMAGVLGALENFAAGHDLSGLAGIGMGSQVNTHVFVDAAGTPLLPAFVWQDSRAAADGAALEAQVSAEQRTAWFGAPIPIDASHALSRIAYVKRVHPELFARTRHVLAAQGLLYCSRSPARWRRTRFRRWGWSIGTAMSPRCSTSCPGRPICCRRSIRSAMSPAGCARACPVPGRR